MKAKTNTIDITQPVELTFPFGAQGSPFVVTGSYEDVGPIAERMQIGPGEAVSVPQSRLAREIGYSLVEQPKRAVEGLLGRLSLDLRAALYDVSNGTHFYRAVQEKRQLEKDLSMAQSLGLLSVEVCAKHRHQLQDVKKVR